ncbi:MAG: EcsC family protein [Rhodothermales bacterium]|nr:EcsC family protein [Rhodothermales bacterium]
MHIPKPELSEYELQVLQEIEAWKNPPATALRQTLQIFNQTMEGVSDLARKIPGVDWTIENVISGLLNLVNEITHDWIFTDAVYQEFSAKGHPVSGPGDVFDLDLEHVDGTSVGLDQKYVSLAGIEGAATGFVGLPGIVPDIIGLTTLNLRAAGEFATYYGFDIATPYERLYALNILTVTSSYNDIATEVTFQPAVRVTKKIAAGQSVEAVSQLAITRSIKKAVEKLGVNLTRAKLAQIIPATGAVVGGSFNIMYSKSVCTAARMLYRERFLSEKYSQAVRITENDED